MAGFTKLFNSILDSTIWQEPNETRILWITMLAMSDASGEIQASIPGLAKRAGISLPECEAALAHLAGPDRYSRTPDHEGRRIRAVEGGWQLLNHGKYRKLLSHEERKEYNRKKQAERRDKIRQAGVNDVSMTVIDNQQCQHISEAEAEAEAEKKKTQNAPDGASPDPKPVAVSWSAENGFSGITEKDMAEWSAAYPAVSLRMQLARAHTWLVDNPAKRKKQVRRFLSGWFSRAQERGGDIPANKPTPAHRLTGYQEKLELP